MAIRRHNLVFSMVSRDITKQEDVIYLARNGTDVAQITLIPKNQGIKRIGAAEGKFKVPEMFGVK